MSAKGRNAGGHAGFGWVIAVCACASTEDLASQAENSDPSIGQSVLEHRSRDHEASADAGEVLVAALRDANDELVGTAQFAATVGGTVVSVSATAPGVLSGFHGFHLHANDDPANGEGCIADPQEPPDTHFLSADGHFNPEGVPHPEHAGDMPVLLFGATGSAGATFVTDRFELDDLAGRAVMIHEKPDNYANVPVGEAADEYTPNTREAIELTLEGGNAGVRLACGVIE